ncbi:MAG: thioredoxin domain-containing protein [Micrococcales bacterium]|nr:thioredoxin domain-containing protein [Micrococcales bacterium]
MIKRPLGLVALVVIPLFLSACGSSQFDESNNPPDVAADQPAPENPDQPAPENPDQPAPENPDQPEPTDQPPTNGGFPAVAPLGAQANGGILLGQDLAPGGPAPSGADVVTVAIYLDFMCPYCSMFELGVGPELSELASAGTIQLEVHSMAFLDAVANAEDYSTRAAKAATAVATHDPANYWAFVGALFADQPAEGSETRSDAQIAATARAVEVSDEAVSHLKDAALAEWVSFTTDQAFANGVGGTPSIQMGLGDGERLTFSGWTEMPFADAVANVQAGRPPDAS